jgi:TolB-like protein
VKKIFLMIFTFFTFQFSFSLEINNFLILSFDNNSIENEKIFITDIITDSLKKATTAYNEIKLVNSDDYKNISDAEIYNKAVLNKVDFILSGYYFDHENTIMINYKLLDVHKKLVVYSNEKTGESSKKIFDIIDNKNNEIIKDILLKVKFHTKKEKIIFDTNYKNEPVKKKEEKWQTFLFFKTGFNYSGLGFINRNGDESLKKNFDISAPKNNYYNFIASSFDFEIYGKNKNIYIGFGFKALLPFMFSLQNFMQYEKITLSIINGFANDFFISFGVYVNSINLTKYPENNNNQNQFNINYFGFGLNFAFRYLPEKYPFFVEAGFSIQPPFKPVISGNNFNPVDSLTISIDYANNQSWFFPLGLDFSGGYFITKQVGLYLEANFYVLSVDYNSNFKYSLTKIDMNYNLDKNFGVDLGLGYNIIFGVCFKSLVK